VSICKFSIFVRSRDHFSAPFRGLYLPNAWSQTIQASKRHTFSLGFPSVPLVWGKMFSVGCAQDRRYPENAKMLFFDLDPYTLQISEIFHDGTRPHHHFDGLSPKSRRSVVSITRSSADADNGLDAFVGQSRSKNILNPFQVK